tara:strand:+ start:29 stop:1570 length:1542 start_codon:yes stop_codon:yes gene_type:complete
MAESGGIYSLLGQVTTDQYKKDRREERKYRKELQRDQLKASLLGVVLNPIAQQVSQGISGAIEKKFGNKYETWKETTEDMYKLAREKKLATTNFEALVAEDTKIKNSGLSMQEYYHQNVSPDYLAVNLDEVLQQKYGSNMANQKSVFKKGVLGALSRELYNKGDTKGFETWAAPYNAYRAGEISDPVHLKKYTKLSKDLFPGGPFGSLLNLVQGKSPESIRQKALMTETQNPIIQSLRRLEVLNAESRKGQVFDLDRLETVLDESEEIERFKRNNQQVVATTIERDPNTGSLVTREVVKTTFPFGRQEKDGTVTTEDTNTVITEIKDADSLKALTLKNIRKGNSFPQMYKQLNVSGRAAFKALVEDEGKSVDNILLSANNGWVYVKKGENYGKSKPLDVILDEFSLLTAIFGSSTGEYLDSTIDAAKQQQLYGADVTLTHAKSYKDLLSDAQRLVSKGTYKNTNEAFEKDTDLAKRYKVWEDELARLNNGVTASNHAVGKAVVVNIQGERQLR